MSDKLFEDLDRAQDEVRSAREVAESTRKDLRDRLDEIRRMPGCPQGSDDAIVAMSYPPAYTACPNPYIEEWLDGLERDGDEPRSDPGPFASDVSVGKGNPFYKAHSYPTKVPHPAIMRFIMHYTEPGDVILDGFAGTGMTGVAAQACANPDQKTKNEIESELGADNVEWGARRAVLGELCPSAGFIAAALNLPVDAEAFDAASKELLDHFDEEYGWMYRTTVHSDNGGSFEATIDYTVWSEVFTCPHCGSAVVYYDVAFDPSTGKFKDSFSCSSCGGTVTKRTRQVRKQSVRTRAGDTMQRVEMRPVVIAWRSGDASGTKRVDDDDLAVLDRIAGLATPPAPSGELPHMHMTHERNDLTKWGITRLHHFWPDRAVAALSILWFWATEQSDPLTELALKFWIEQAFWGLSWMNRYRPDGYSQVSQYQSGVYYIPSLTSECSVRYNLEGSSPARGKRQSLVKMWRSSPARFGQVMISTGSSTTLPLPDESVDYVFVDPPFGQNIYYSDLAYLVEAWHGNTSAPEEEAIESKNRQAPKSLDVYADLMRRCFEEFYRALKPGRWMTVEFSNSSNDVWLRIQNALASAGFVVADTRIIDKKQLSYRQVTADNAVKHDLVISAYRPAKQAEQSFDVSAGSTDSAWAFVREHLARLPVTEGQRGQAQVIRERLTDRIYERMVAYHVARNVLVPMTAAEFYAGLEQRFPVRDNMYFLPDQVESYERFRITFKDLAQQTLIIRDESSAVQWLRQLLKARPRTFAEIHPRFIAEMQAGVADWEQMPELRELLEGNFVVDDQGRWMVPDPKRAEHLDQLRTRALLREFNTYREGKGRLSRFRSEAVRAGFKEAWAQKDFDAIVKVGHRLPEDAFVEDSALLHYLRNAERLAS